MLARTGGDAVGALTRLCKPDTGACAVHKGKWRMTDETTTQSQDAATAPEATCDTSSRTRRRTVVVALLAALALVGASFTVANVVDTKTAENVLTFGSVKMQVVQTETVGGQESPVPTKGYDVKASSGVASRNVTFENVGSNPLYVRAKPVMTGLDAQDQVVPAEDVAEVTAFQMDDSSKWTQKDPDDGWWYYTDVVQPGDSTSPLMTGIEFSGDYVGVVGQYGRYEFTVEAQAVQSENQAESATALTAEGWPGSENDAEGE